MLVGSVSKTYSQVSVSASLFVDVGSGEMGRACLVQRVLVLPVGRGEEEPKAIQPISSPASSKWEHCTGVRFYQPAKKIPALSIDS
jgi:hypothetical protein